MFHRELIRAPALPDKEAIMSKTFLIKQYLMRMDKDPPETYRGRWVTLPLLASMIEQHLGVSLAQQQPDAKKLRKSNTSGAGAASSKLSSSSIDPVAAASSILIPPTPEGYSQNTLNLLLSVIASMYDSPFSMDIGHHIEFLPTMLICVIDSQSAVNMHVNGGLVDIDGLSWISQVPSTYIVRFGGYLFTEINTAPTIEASGKTLSNSSVSAAVAAASAFSVASSSSLKKTFSTSSCLRVFLYDLVVSAVCHSSSSAIDNAAAVADAWYYGLMKFFRMLIIRGRLCHGRFYSVASIAASMQCASPNVELIVRDVFNKYTSYSGKTRDDVAWRPEDSGIYFHESSSSSSLEIMFYQSEMFGIFPELRYTYPSVHAEVTPILDVSRKLGGCMMLLFPALSGLRSHEMSDLHDNHQKLCSVVSDVLFPKNCRPDKVVADKRASASSHQGGSRRTKKHQKQQKQHESEEENGALL